MATPKTILVSGSGHRKEGVTDEAVTPGHLLELGGSNDLQKHSSADGNAAAMFALENDLVGDGIDTAYASGDTVQYVIAYPGAKIYALLGDGENVAVGADLASNGDGTLAAHTLAVDSQPVNAVICRALEAVNASGDSRILVEVV